MVISLRQTSRSRRPWATGVFWRLLFFALCSFVLAPLSASVASFGQLFEKVQWNIPRQINLSCLNISIQYTFLFIYIYREREIIYTCEIYIYMCVCVYVSEKYIYVHKYKQEDMYICMYTSIVKTNVYVCTCLFTYMYLNVIFIA